MGRRKRNIAALLLLAVITVPVFFSVIFVYEQAAIKEKSRSVLKNAALTTVTAPAAAVTWIEKGEEAVINGRFFDVSSFKIKDGVITLTGLYDVAEDELMDDLKQSNVLQNEKSSPYTALVIKFVSESNCIMVDNLFQCTSFSNIDSHTYSFYNEAVHTVAAQPLFQPPRC